jgi:hypothetical protein
MVVQSLLSQLTNAATANRKAADLMLDAAARIEDLQDYVSRLENDLADARKEARG